MKISKRLESLASLVDKNLILADIGSDHGLLIKKIKLNGYTLKCYAVENKKGPFNRLKKSLNDYQDVICYLGDGLQKLPSDVKQVIIAGMGGQLILKILERDDDYLKNLESIILAPHGEEEAVRRYMYSQGFKIDQEIIVYEEHYYELMRFIKGKELLSDKEFRFGPKLIEHSLNLLKNKYQELINQNQRLLMEERLSERRINDIKKEIEDYQELWKQEK